MLKVVPPPLIDKPSQYCLLWDKLFDGRKGAEYYTLSLWNCCCPCTGATGGAGWAWLWTTWPPWGCTAVAWWWLLWTAAMVGPWPPPEPCGTAETWRGQNIYKKVQGLCILPQMCLKNMHVYLCIYKDIN